MTHPDVFDIVTKLPANETTSMFSQMVARANMPKLYAFAVALERLVPSDQQSHSFRQTMAGLRAGYANCGSAARRAVECGADPEVVVATARLILT